MTINDCGCTMISSLDSKQLLDFLLMANGEEFIFRNKLVLDSSISYGNEIEFNDLSLDATEILVYEFNNQHNLCGDNVFAAHDELTADGEVVTPIMRNKQVHWDRFYDMYKALYFAGATVGENTASHIHIGMQHINTAKLLSNYLKMLVVFEPIIFKFGYGYGNSPREFIRSTVRNGNYAMMSSPKRYSDFISGLRRFKANNTEEMKKLFSSFLALDLEFRPVFNFKDFCFDKLLGNSSSNSSDHMEVRCFNGTLDPVIGQNNINLLTHIYEAVIMERIDEKYLEQEYQRYRKKRYNFDCWRAIIEDDKESIRYNRLLDGFSEVKMEKALKLADMIFTNDLDKVYFLKQYLKLFDSPVEDVKRLIK